MVGRKKQPVSDQAEDLECLCHLMKTCGRILDTSKGKLRMDQYIERLEQTSDNPQMPLRIRFMLQVCIYYLEERNKPVLKNLFQQIM